MSDFDKIVPDPSGSTHIPVLLDTVMDGLGMMAGMRAIDGTLGGGGHTAALLAKSAPDGQVMAIDADPAAIRRNQIALANYIDSRRLQLVLGNFGNIEEIARTHEFTAVDAILFDLGVSSFQLDTPDRGFSFRQDGPLDMRFNPQQGESAAEIVNQWPEADLADLIYRYGEERKSRRIARYLVAHRPFSTTSELAGAVERAVGGRRGQRIHPATRTFQALRIAVNEELRQIEDALPQALTLLKSGGRLAVISFHSLEDRIVKQWMQQEARDYVPDPHLPMGGYTRTPTVSILTRKPLVATDAEIEQNPRSRSAKLRIVEKL